MRRDGTAAGRIFLRIGILLLILSPNGCGIFDTGNPESAKVVLSGAEGTTVQLVTTNDFIVLPGDNEETRTVDVLSADTAMVSSPYRKTYSLGDELRFYMNVESEGALSEPLTVKVFIEDDLRYNITTLLGEEEVEFTYTLR